MENILFINACPRQKERSRSFALAENFLREYCRLKSNVNIQEKNLYKENIECYSLDEINKRDTLLANKEFQNEMFSNARRFADADKIVIAAPFWDLSFPAILKAYIEQICVCGITFKYTENGSVGLSKAQSIAYLSTSGGYPTRNYGSEYIKAIAEFLGIENFVGLTIGGLDIWGNDVDDIMSEGFKQAKELAKNF